MSVFSPGAFFRLSRLLHGYLSAFAFIVLIFFCVTGLFLNHPNWLAGEPAETATRLTLPKAAVAQAMAAPDPAKALAEAVAGRPQLIGRYKSGEIQDGEAFLQFQGARGASTATLDVASGSAEITDRPSSTLTMLNDLHRGKNTGAAWSWVIDLSAVLITALSLLGYVLFFCMRYRLRTSLLITAASLAVMAAVFLLLTP